MNFILCGGDNIILLLIQGINDIWTQIEIEKT